MLLLYYDTDRFLSQYDMLNPILLSDTQEKTNRPIYIYAPSILF